ncbi:MAG TPA: restriction endonuclease [Xanthomonadaceae bacterium]|nr:restriction endonuclease [Xanthomonadaceae bacterium]
MESSTAIAAAAALLVFAAAALALGLANRRSDERAAALQRLRAMRWQDLALLVADMLSVRGLQRDDVDRHPGKDGFDLRVSRGSARYLVQCKHGAAFQVESATVQELQRMVAMQGADGGILVTTGTITPQARAWAAAQAGMELIDGLQLWPQVEPLLDAEVRDTVMADARERRLRKWLLAAALGVVAGICAALLLALSPPAAETSEPSPGSRPAPAAPAPQPPQQQEAEPVADVAGAVPMPDPSLSEEQLEDRRADAQRMVQTIAEIELARWITRSTLLLELRGMPGEQALESIVEAVCGELLVYEELRYTRLQLQPAGQTEGETVTVRWRQCR